MDMQQIINRAERNIRQALEDYKRHTTQSDVIDDVSECFIKELARDSAHAKQDLRELFSQSPVWDEELDALVINGTRTHNPDYDRIDSLGREILRNVWWDNYEDLTLALRLFTQPFMADDEKQRSIDAINRLAPKAYSPTKKQSRVFKALCVKLGVADETAGSTFQRLYAQFADELTAKKLGFKLYASINPAHFITMSNPKYDRRGNTLTSCHSFNSTEYQYNNGCTGYARDNTSFIVFTVADPSEAETLNNRKTTRQVFAYKPGNGLLMQSRMYNTSGGVYGASEDSKLYRDIIQREISMLENMPNLWKTSPYLNGHESDVVVGDGFGGYPDWTYSNFDGKVSIRNDKADSYEPITVGTWGLCIDCGCETNDGVYCDDCKNSDDCYCDHCEEYCDETTWVRDENGNEIQVCNDCLDQYYIYCEECQNYHPRDNVRYVEDTCRYVCDDCLEEYYDQCDECEKYFLKSDMTEVRNKYGEWVRVCERHLEEYFYCEHCGEYHHNEEYNTVYTDRENKAICDDCLDSYEECPECGERIIREPNACCPNCGCYIEIEEEDE